MKEPLFKGIISPMVTPLVGRDELDRGGLDRLVERLVNGGVHGIFILGTSGEAPSLSYHLRRELITRVCALVGGKAPVLVGVSDTAFVESVNMAVHAADAGASAVVLTAPYYFPADQAELIQYFEDIVPRLPLPVILYNMPEMTKTTLDIETLRRLSSMEKITGIKDSGGDIGYFGELVALHRRRPDWSVLMGPEHLLVESLKLGGDGGVNGGSILFPRLLVQCYESAVSGDEKRTREIGEVMKIIHRLYEVGRHSSRVIKGVKCALSIMGVCDDFMAEPFHRFREPEREEIRNILEEVRNAMNESEALL